MRSKLFLLFSLAAASPAAAQTGDVVVTANRTAQPADEVGQSVTVIAAEEIAARQSVAVVDLLRTVPGVGATRAGGIGTAASVNIRGADPQQTLLLVDGVKLDDPASPSGGYDFGTLLTGTIERIEVVRGSQSVIWGSRAIGGVVNVITRAPSADPELTARAEYGGRDQVQASAAASGAFGPVRASIGGHWLSTDGISAFDEAAGGRERDGYRGYGAAARIEVAAGDALVLDLRGRFDDGRTDLDGFAPPSFAFGDTGDRSTTAERVGYAGVRWSLLGGRLRNRAGLAATRIDRTNLDPTGTPTFDSRGSNRRVDYQGNLDLGPVGAVFGAEDELSRFRAESFGARSSARATIRSVYGELTLRPAAGLAVAAGVRRDEHSRFGGATTVAANGSFSPNGGATRLRASYGEGFGAPSLYQLFGDYGNASLVPERSRSIDGGIVQRLLGERIEASLTAFRRDSENQIDFVSCFGSTRAICAGRPFGTYDNVRDTRAQGIEAAVTLQPVPPLTVRFAYAHLDARNRATGRELARRPRETASLVADWRSTRGPSAGITVAHVGDSFDDPANARRLDGFALVDLRAGLPLAGAIELYGRVENLFDEVYQTVAGYGQPRRSAHAGVRLRL